MIPKISFSAVDATSNPVEWMYRIEDAGFQGWEIVGEGEQKVEGEFKERVREVLYPMIWVPPPGVKMLLANPSNYS